MSLIRSYFATPLYQASFAEEPDFDGFNADLKDACAMLAKEDRAGRAWCRANGYRGYTSYASLNDLPARASAFAALKRRLDRHAAAFAEALHFDLGGRRLKLDSLWVNLLQPGGAHSGHIHPNSVVSGVVYLQVSKGAGALRLEDPRLPLMMAAPALKVDAPNDQRRFVYLKPEIGTLYLWESWLRHEVLPHKGPGPRLSVSFNYA
jgi:uncharacterized protein (TIGR02466 family)